MLSLTVCDIYDTMSKDELPFNLFNFFGEFSKMYAYVILVIIYCKINGLFYSPV